MTETNFTYRYGAESSGARLQPLLTLSQPKAPEHNRRKTDRPREARMSVMPGLQGSWSALRETVSGVVRGI